MTPVAITLLSSLVYGGEYPLRAEIESCLSEKMASHYSSFGTNSMASFFLPNDTNHHVVATVLGESIATNSHDDRKFVIGVGGTISPTLLAAGLERFLYRSATRETDSKSEWPGVTLAYYTHYSLTDEVRDVVRKYKIDFSVHDMDARTNSSLLGSGC